MATGEDKCNYNGAVVLGLNDALVELSGALVGLSFALMETKTIATVGLITGFA
ncbi:rubrerythrin family protein, partial [Candidatus Pacearchaeota archaeon]|nr:rubrerythrin family protein [Candidatus Pacearchaeota archaeon]